MYYKVRQFINEPRRCYNCQRVGHMAASCTSKMHCRLCSGNHRDTECTLEAKDYHCSNCKGNHKANSKECSLYNQAKEIEKVKIMKSISYVEARKTVLARNNSNFPRVISQRQEGKTLKQFSNIRTFENSNSEISYRDKLLGLQ